MYNLLIRYKTWGDGRDAFPIDRLFEATDDNVAASFKDGSTLLLDRLISHPCLFMQEGVNDELAYVGTIYRARPVGNDLAIEYTYELDIPPLLNSAIYSNRLDFDITRDSEFTRTHWAVKDVDLYRVLLRSNRPRRRRPTVFQLPDNERIEPALVSAMMPFEASFTPVYDGLKATAEKVGLRCRRADDIWENPAIIQDIVSLIDRSRVVICDCSGRNPNVFYEIGIAHTLGREVILITQNEADVPFDLRHLRYVRYLNNAEGRQELCRKLEARLSDLMRD
ncbi:hypothetical protein CWO89_32895 [Bradyrhizobium sp. Leo170]|nr:hypothetical protein CWO89_32895 [Bradyrhizobium sp. Leo170]